MIKGSELLTGCVNEIIQVANGLEAKYGSIVITSGFRSIAHNAEVGGVSDSQHCLGKAIDVYIENVSPIKVAAFALDNFMAIRGVGLAIYQGYAHLDVRDGDRVYWAYDRSGKAI